MSDHGWIKIDRKISEWGWYKDHSTFRLFFHLLLHANWKPSEYQGHKVGRGEIVIGINALASQVGLSVQATRTSLKKLEKSGEINKRSTNKFSIVSICKYDTYQCQDEETNKPTTNEQQTNNKRATTSKERKKEKRENLGQSAEKQESAIDSNNSDTSNTKQQVALGGTEEKPDWYGWQDLDGKALRRKPKAGQIIYNPHTGIQQEY
jgi:hypothetical protein